MKEKEEKEEEQVDRLFVASQKDIQLNEEECLSIARDLGYISANSEQDYSCSEGRERFRQFRTWKKLVELKSVRPKTLAAIRALFGVMLKHLEEILTTDLGNNENRWDLRNFLENSILYWLIMPRFELEDSVRDPLSTVGQLSANLEPLVAVDKISYSLWGHLRGVFDSYTQDMDASMRSRFWLALHRAVWFSLIDSGRLGSTFFVYSITRIPASLSLSDVSDDYRVLLLDIHNYITKLGRSRLRKESHVCLDMIIRLKSWAAYKLFLAERMKLLELIIFRELMDSDWFLEFGFANFMNRLDQTLEHQWSYTLERCRIEALAAQTFVGSLYSLYEYPSRPPCTQGIQSVKWLVLGLCRGIIKDAEFFNASHLSLIAGKLKHLELAYKCRRTQEYPPDRCDLLPSCVELAFATPFENPQSCKHVCEFTYFRDTLDYLERKKPEILEEANEKEDLRTALQYYQHEYDEFELCCSTLDASAELKFKCVGHNYCPGELGEAVCPLLKRRFLCDHEGRYWTDAGSSAIFEFSCNLSPESDISD